MKPNVKGFCFIDLALCELWFLPICCWYNLFYWQQTNGGVLRTGWYSSKNACLLIIQESGFYSNSSLKQEFLLLILCFDSISHRKSFLSLCLCLLESVAFLVCHGPTQHQEIFRLSHFISTRIELSGLFSTVQLHCQQEMNLKVKPRYLWFKSPWFSTISWCISIIPSWFLCLYFST